MAPFIPYPMMGLRTPLYKLAGRCCPVIRLRGDLGLPPGAGFPDFRAATAFVCHTFNFSSYPFEVLQNRRFPPSFSTDPCRVWLQQVY